MLCDGRPDPLNTCDLNTFMNLWREDKENKPMSIVLKEGEDSLKVIQRIHVHVLFSGVCYNKCQFFNY